MGELTDLMQVVEFDTGASLSHAFSGDRAGLQEAGFDPAKAAMSDWEPFITTICNGDCTLKREGREALSINAPVDVLPVTPAIFCSVSSSRTCMRHCPFAALALGQVCCIGG